MRMNLGLWLKSAFTYPKFEYDDRDCHILNIENPSEDNELEKRCSLIHNGKMLNLPACNDCFGRLKKADKFWKEETKTVDIPSCSDSSKSNNGGLSAWDKAICMLKRLSFKRCDLGRIPKDITKLNNCERTAIAPFVAFSIIRQLCRSKHLPGSAQHSTRGSKFSIPSEEVGGKEFIIPLTHDEFVNSFQQELPREEIAERHRVLFLGNLRDWKSMESTLNLQNRGQFFNAVECYNFLRLLKRTGALSSNFSIKRQRSVGLLQRKVDIEMSRTTSTTDSSTGIVLEPSARIRQMEKKCSDDVAAARLLLDNDGTKTTAPGISSSLFWNRTSHDGKLPLLRNILSNLPGKQRMNNDPLLLKIKRELPNEFKNFTQITTHTFPDLFPIPLKDSEINPLNFRSVSIRRHLLDFYDSRFCNKIFIFWLFGILTRHKSCYETCAFF